MTLSHQFFGGEKSDNCVACITGGPDVVCDFNDLNFSRFAFSLMESKPKKV